MALPVGQKVSQSPWPFTSFRGLKIMLSILFSEGEKQNMLHCSSMRYTSCQFELVIITRSPHCHHSLPYIPVRATDTFISESISVASLWYLPLCPTHEMRGPPFKIPRLFSSNCVYIQSPRPASKPTSFRNIFHVSANTCIYFLVIHLNNKYHF